MSYQFPQSANRSSATNTAAHSGSGQLLATVALMALAVGGMIAFAVASLAFGGDDAMADTTIAAPAVSTPLDAGPATPPSASPDASTPDASTPAPPASAPVEPAPAPGDAPAPPPAPVVFRPTCSVSQTALDVGQEFVISGSHVPAGLPVTWTFDHGDGYQDHANPSFAYYNHPGTYQVTGWADTGNGVHEVHCGTVEVHEPAAPVEFYCNVSNPQPRVGEVTVFTGSTDPHDIDVTWTFDHGDGYQETANPSEAVYDEPGTYNVVAFAEIDGEYTQVVCETVEVIADLPAPACSIDGYVGLPLLEAELLAESRGCSYRSYTGELDFLLAGAGFDHQPDRVNFLVLPNFLLGDVVFDVKIG